jgi:hypothetical protein
VDQSKFPLIPDNLRENYEVQDLFLRPFGTERVDLDINFKSRSPPFLTTQIISNCTLSKNGKKPKVQFYWDLPIGTRIECLVSLTLMANNNELELRVRCDNTNCRKIIGFILNKQNFVDFVSQIMRTEKMFITINDKNLVFRKPTGNDLQKWLKNEITGKSDSKNIIIRNLMIDNGYQDDFTDSIINPQSIKEISDMMKKYDPLVNFSIDLNCPYCHEEYNYSLNLGILALRKLQEVQKSLISRIHFLAVYYHWNEEDFFSIPHWRRLEYVSLIEKLVNR